MKAPRVEQLTVTELDRKAKYENYGDWRTVSRNYRRQSRRNLDEIKDQIKDGTGSRFTVIVYSIYEEEDLPQMSIIRNTDFQKRNEDIN